MIAVVPGYISRSVAGSYDNEGEHSAGLHPNIICSLNCQDKVMMECLLRYRHLLYAVDVLHVD